MAYRMRTIDTLLDGFMPYLSAIALDGAKGVGKTATAQRRADWTLSLDSPAARESVLALPGVLEDPSQISEHFPGEGAIFLDEWQHLPQVWNSVRHGVDRGARPGQFLLAGSATPVDRAGTHSGAGRIVSLRMRPMGFHERDREATTVSFKELLHGDGQASVSGRTSLNAVSYAEEIVRSGFPGIRDFPARIRHLQLESYIEHIVDRDLPEAGFGPRNPHQLVRWLEAYAAATATTTAYSKLLVAATSGDGTRPTKATSLAYREHLTRIWVLDSIRGWSPSNSPLKRLATSPKHFLADPALVTTLLGIDIDNLLAPGGMMGQLFEALVALTVQVLAQACDARVFHLRTESGIHEVDLIIERPDRRILAVEVKTAAVATDEHAKHLNWLMQQWPERVIDRVIINTGQRAYRRPDGVAVVPLALVGE